MREHNRQILIDIETMGMDVSSYLHLYISNGLISHADEMYKNLFLDYMKPEQEELIHFTQL